MSSTLTPNGWIVDKDVVDERKDLPRLTSAQVDILNGKIAAGSNEYPVGTKIVRIEDGVTLTLEGVGPLAQFVPPGLAPVLAVLAQPTGASLVGYDGGTVQDVADEAKPLANYAALRAYTGRASGVRITDLLTGGIFERDPSDATTADNGGTVIVDGAGRRWKRVFDGAVNVLWFGAKGDGVTDDQPAIQSLIDAISASGVATTIVGPSRKFFCGATVTLKKFVSLIGQNKNFELAFNNAAQDGIVVSGDTTQTSRSVRDITLSGTMRDAFVAANTPVTNLGGFSLDISNIIVKSGSHVTNGFTFANFYNASARNLGTSGAIVTNACFRMLATVNGVSFDNLYTGGNQGHLYGIYFEGSERPAGDATLPQGHGVMFNAPVLQGGKYGMYIANGRGLTINNPYFESVANPMVFGVAGGSILVRGIAVNGGTYGGATVANPFYAERGPIFRFTNARSIVINAPELFQPANALACTVTGGGGSSGAVWVLINRDGTPAAYVIDSCGRSYATPPTVTPPTPVSGTADTLTATVSGGRITGVSVTAPGASPVYAAGDNYPVAVLYGQRVSKVKFISPYCGFNGDAASFQMLVGRDSTAVSSNGIEVDGDAMLDGQVLQTRKTEGFGHLHAHTFQDATGSFVSWVTATPLISAP